MMRHEEFTGKVQALAALPDRASAERAVRATLETLAERIPVGAAEHVAAQLPHELAEHLRRVTAGHRDSPARLPEEDHFGLPAFFGRVAWRAGVSDEAAIRQAAAVLEVLDAALSPELMAKLGHVLPADIRELLPAARAEQPWPP